MAAAFSALYTASSGDRGGCYTELYRVQKGIQIHSSHGEYRDVIRNIHKQYIRHVIHNADSTLYPHVHMLTWHTHVEHNTDM